MIRDGRADVVVAGGTEAAIHPVCLAAFAAMQALSTRNDDPAAASRPYDANRDGFVLGEGAGVVVLESEEHARARGAKIYAEVAGAGMSNDAYHIAAPDPVGAGAARAMRAALAEADASVDDVVHVNAHSTSTPVGDVAEAGSIHAALGEAAAQRAVVSATKSMTGHMLGAAGAVEAIFTVLAVQHRLAPPTINVDQARPRDPPRRRDRQAARSAAGRRAGPEQLLRLRRRERRAGDPEHLMTTTSAPAAAGSTGATGSDDAPRSTRATRACGWRRSSTTARSSLLTERDDSGMLAGRGTVDGTPAVAFVSDATIQGGAMGEAGCKAILVAYERALADGVPVVGLWHSGGARLREGVVSLHAVGEVFAIMTRASGKIPQISVVIGAAAGGAAYGPALTDVVVLGPDGRIFVTGPDVVRSVTGESVDALRLGGPEPHGRRSGVVHVVTETTEEAFARGRLLVQPARGAGRARHRRGRRPAARRACCRRTASAPTTCTRWWRTCSTSPRPRSSLHPRWAPNITTTLGRLGGRTVGVIANNPLRLGGCLDSSSAEKAARFVRMCDAFGVPLVVVVDVPGYLPGVGQEWDGVVRRGAACCTRSARPWCPASRW
ncbi:hypothetical protein GCM10025868_00110 [Angustibacter aerolatus]|uniref:Ketosynthase (KS) domain-containing protein n=1 Tax=Angustibacter aerolatus TaxID=1162965 RepID=A0ABQ6J9B4_9ACTN|nr:hypothetical protein GCM10025868_00110 [Angustibacter aerolatus]